MANNSDKSFSLKVIAACIIAIAIFHFAWLHQFGHNLSNVVFDFFYAVFWVAVIKSAMNAYKYAEDADKDNSSKWVLVIVTIIMLIWLGGWAAGTNEKNGVQEYINEHATYGN